MDGYEFSGISFVPKTLERMREVNQYKLALFGAKLRLTMVRDVLHNQINGKRGIYRLEVGHLMLVPFVLNVRLQDSK